LNQPRSSESRSRFQAIPEEKPPSCPLEPVTRWHGINRGRGRSRQPAETRFLRALPSAPAGALGRSGPPPGNARPHPRPEPAGCRTGRPVPPGGGAGRNGRRARRRFRP
jgi:hypothetical protein